MDPNVWGSMFSLLQTVSIVVALLVAWNNMRNSRRSEIEKGSEATAKITELVMDVKYIKSSLSESMRMVEGIVPRVLTLENRMERMPVLEQKVDKLHERLDGHTKEGKHTHD